MSNAHAFRAVAHELLAAGHSPIPIVPGQKRPALSAWQRACEVPLTADERNRFARSPLAYGVGIACGYGGLIAIDIDTDDPEIKAAIRSVIGPVRCAKRGRKGLTAFFFDPTGGIRARKFQGHDGMLVEILARGNQTVLPPTIHPDTGLPYEWLGRHTLLNTRPEELPHLPADIAERLEEALAPWLKVKRQTTSTYAVVPKSTDLDDRSRRRLAAYGRQALQHRVTALAAMGRDSGRNKAAFDAVCRVGRYVHHGLLPQVEVADAVLAACEANGLVKEDGRPAVLKTIRQGLLRSEHDPLPDLSAPGRAVA